MPKADLRRYRVPWRFLGLSFGFLALLGVASHRVAQMKTLELGIFTLVLSVPMMLALWRQVTVRHLVGLHQFQSGRVLHWWASRRTLGFLFHGAIALALTGAVLLQSKLFSPAEWVLLCMSPGMYLAVHRYLHAKSKHQFSHKVYALRWSFWATQGLVALILAAFWLAARYLMADAPAKPIAELVYDLQSAWTNSPSGIIKWTLDAGAWGQAAIEAFGHPQDSPKGRLLVALLVAPVSVFGHMALTLSGISLPLSEIRRTFGEPMTAADNPPPVGPVQAAIWAAVGTICVMLVFHLLGVTDSWLKPRDSPFASKRLPECERIGGVAYQVNTIQALHSLLGGLQKKMDSRQAAACQELAGIEAAAAKGVDAYLDWYFSLGADWTRLVTMLTGDIDLLLQAKFEQLALSNPDQVHRLLGVQDQYEQSWSDLMASRGDLQGLLERHRIVLSEQQCKVVRELGSDPWTPKLEGFKARLVTGSGAGLFAGVFAAKVAAKVMSKASMKLAGKVLLKAAAKKGISKVGAAAAGAAIGTWVVPGVGTVVGALVGTGVGVAFGVAIDIGALAAEEKLTRPDMKRDLLSAVTESLQPFRETFACTR